MTCLLAKAWDPTMDPTGWWMSEKLDGVRAIWTGKKLLTRTGKDIAAPKWFTEALPVECLDGELFGGRKNFQDLVSAVRKGVPNDAAWSNVTFRIFDLPENPGVFEARQMCLREMLYRLPAWADKLPQTLCLSVQHLRDTLTYVEELGGEGVMLRQPGSLYVPKRSGTLLKVKTFHDAEATVIAHMPGKGRHVGRLGALSCTWLGGAPFEVGTGFSDIERDSPPPVGASITFRYQELTRDKVPRFPVYVATRDYE